MNGETPVTQIQVPDSWISLPVPVPSLLEQALGYDGKGRFVAFYWTPIGDEAMFPLATRA